MIEITTLRDYDSKHGYQSHLALLSSRKLGGRGNHKFGINAIDMLKARFFELFGYQPLRVRYWTNHVVTAGPIEESEGAPNVKR